MFQKRRDGSVLYACFKHALSVPYACFKRSLSVEDS